MARSDRAVWFYNNAMPTRVLVLTPSPLRGNAWRALLAGQPELEVLGVGAEPAALAGDLPAVLLVDSGEAPIELARRLRAQLPQAGLLFLVPGYDLAGLLPLLQAGVLGCVAHTEPVPELIRGLIAVSRGELFLPPAIAGQALIALARGEAPGPAAANQGWRHEAANALNVVIGWLADPDLQRDW